jgi:hypothetical protein
VDTQPKRGESSTVPKVKTVSHEDDTTQADLALALSVMQTRLTSLEEDLIETRAERSDFARTIREQGASIDGIMQHVRALESRKPEAAARGDGELRVFVPRWCIKKKQVETWSHKTSMATGLQSAAISSFETILPSVLVGNMKTGSGGSYDWLHSYLKTFSVWEPTGHKNGVSKRIQDGVTSTRARRYLSNHFQDDPALTGIFVRRVLLHGNDTTAKQQLAKIPNLQRKIDNHARQATFDIKKMQETIRGLKQKP